MSNKGNQIRNEMIRRHGLTDQQKNAGIESFLVRKYPRWFIIPQAYLTFTKGEDEFQFVSRTLTKEEVKEYKTQHPDFYILRDGKVLLLELDGKWHDLHTEQTLARNEIYRLNNLHCIVVNETNLKYKLGIPDSRPLTQEQINDEFDRRINDGL